MARKTTPVVTEATDSMGYTIRVDDLVMANIREYRRTTNPNGVRSGGSRRMVRAHIAGFVGEDKVRLALEETDPLATVASWVSSHHCTLIATAEMAEGYKESFNFHAKKGN